jgi:hypothetical protein
VKALTVRELIEVLTPLRQDQKVVFNAFYHGDFDVTHDTGASLSEDNFVNDKRPILHLQKRKV